MALSAINHRIHPQFRLQCWTMNQRLVSKLNDSLNHDFCPWANAYVYWLKRPIGWVVLAFLASLLLGIYVSPQSYLASAAIAVVGVIGCLWPWIAMFGIHGKLSWSHERCEEGEQIQVSMTMVNRWPWPVWGLVIELDDSIAGHSDAPEARISLSRLPALAESRFRWTCRPKNRGVFPARPARITTAFPFGIWTCGRLLHVGSRLIVWPKTIKLTDVPDCAGTRQTGIGSVSNQIGDEGDWMGVRPYRPGDSLRQVAWAQTARRETLVVFERQTRSRQDIAIWIDPIGIDAVDDEQREWMIRLLASFTNHFAGHAWNVHAAIDTQWSSHLYSPSTRHRWLDKLAAWSLPLQPTCVAAFADSIGCSQIVITTSSRKRELQRQLSSRSSEVLWVVVHGEETNCESEDSIVSDSANVLYVSVTGDVVQQLQSQWKRICQKTIQMAS